MSWPRFRSCLGFGLALLLATGLFATPARPQDGSSEREARWPREIVVEDGQIVIYQPHLESLEGDKLTARTAVAVTRRGADAPVFGAMWFDCRLATDWTTRIVTLTEVKVTQARAPGARQEGIDRVIEIVEREVPKWNLQLTRDALIEAVETIDREGESSSGLSNDPPEILYRDRPTILIVFDGVPETRPVENSSYQRVINTPFVIFRRVDGAYNIQTSPNLWYLTRDLLYGPYSVAYTLPAELLELAPSSGLEWDERSQAPDASPPEIITSIQPAELIQTQGAPRYREIAGTALLFVENASQPLFLEQTTEVHYVLLSGRWFQAFDLEGPWTYVRPDVLPPDFARIPEDSPAAGVRFSIPGTPEAQDAVVDAQIPHTAVVDRSAARIDVLYEGQPEFVSAGAPGVSYAVNTPTAVFEISGSYYACDNGVWFVAQGPRGEWRVSETVPPEVDQIPPSCPHYNTRYVEVYESTPEKIYVGYTAGYLGNYVVGSTVVHGTGYQYPGWYGRTLYVPRPITYGLSVHYEPPAGWIVGTYVSGLNPSPYFRDQVDYGGWWGPTAYRPPVQRSGHGDEPLPATPVTARSVYGMHPRPGVRPATEPAPAIAASPSAPTQQPVIATFPVESQGTMRPSGQPNDVYVDATGELYRRRGDSWEQRTGDGWRPADRARMYPGGGNIYTLQDLERQYEARRQAGLVEPSGGR